MGVGTGAKPMFSARLKALALLVWAHAMAALIRAAGGIVFTIAVVADYGSRPLIFLVGLLPSGAPLSDPGPRADRGQSALGIFGVLVFGAIALVVVSITLLFGMDIAGEFADGIDVDNDYSDEANSTVNSTGQAFELFGTSVLVIPAAAVLTVLIGGMVGAVASVQGGNLPGAGRGR